MSGSRTHSLQPYELYNNLIDLSRHPEEKAAYRQKQIEINSIQNDDEININLDELTKIRDKLFHSQYMRGKNLLRQLKEFITIKEYDECIIDFDNQSKAAYSAKSFSHHSEIVQQLEIFLANKINAREDQLQPQAVYEKEQTSLLIARKKAQLETQKGFLTTSAALIEQFDGLTVKQQGEVEEKKPIDEIQIQRQKNIEIFSSVIKLCLELSTLLPNPQEKKTYSDQVKKITTMQSNLQTDTKIDLKSLVNLAAEWEPAISRLEKKIRTVKETNQPNFESLQENRPKPF